MCLLVVNTNRNLNVTDKIRDKLTLIKLGGPARYVLNLAATKDFSDIYF